MTSQEKLTALAHNLWWSWNPSAQDLFQRLNPDLFQASLHNPCAALQSFDPNLLSDPAFGRNVDAVHQAFVDYLNAPPQYPEAPRIGYFCMEFGLHESLPLYSGGLGILAGDHLKAASDLGLPFTAIGLFLKDGYFEQHVDAEGRQQETYPALDPNLHPVHLVLDAEGQAVTVTVHLASQPVLLRAWKVMVGKTVLFLLDADVEDNPEEVRSITHKLYQGDRKARIQQEIILGIGGVRLLRVLGVETDVYHMNEGHCAFLTLELLREEMAKGVDLEAASDWVRQHCVFTTHTPVAAGHDQFAPTLFAEQMAGFRGETSLSMDELMAWGTTETTEKETTENTEREETEKEEEAVEEGTPFNMTVLALKLSRSANGVSELHGEVARRQWHHLYPELALEDVPIGAITNGVHQPTWAAPLAHVFLNKHLGPWSRERHRVESWRPLEQVSDEELWHYRTQLRQRLIDFIRERTGQPDILDPEALTIGFARRFATYKRAPLLFHDLARAARLFALPGQPVQVVYAGKAHPADEGGKAFIQQIYAFTQDPDFQGKVVFLENYNMEVGRMLVSGSDIWLNNPQRPLEASGTSGQKVAIHGGMNLSILDGWWPEGYNQKNGRAIGRTPTGLLEEPSEFDDEDATSLYQLLETEVIPTFYDRDDDDLPHGWIDRMRDAMITLPGPFSALRMVMDYTEKIYSVNSE